MPESEFVRGRRYGLLRPLGHIDRLDHESISAAASADFTEAGLARCRGDIEVSQRAVAARRAPPKQPIA